MFLNETRVESIMAGGHRSMSRKNNLARDSSHRFFKADALIVHSGANRFKHRKRAVPFVQVQNTRSDPDGSEGAEASNTKKQFLTNSNTSVPAVETRCQIAILRSVASNV